MIVKIEMAVDAIQEAQRRVKAKKAAAEIVQGMDKAFDHFFNTVVRPIAEQIEAERRKAEENEEYSGEDGQGRQV